MNIDGNPIAGNDEDIQIELDPVDIEKTAEGANEAPAKSAEEGIEEFRRQLEEEKAARQRERDGREAAERERQAAQQQAEQWRNAATTREQQAAEAAMHSAEQAAANAKARAKAALEAGDYDTALEAQQELAKQTYATEQFRRELELAKSRPAPKVERTEPDPLAQYTPKTREWIRAHPDVLTNPAKSARAQAAHHDAIEAGLELESDAYFALVEERLGYRKAEAPKRETVAAAPPSRGDTTSPRPASATSVRLSAAERELCAQMSIDPKEYARNKLAMERASAKGY